jgi:hypothetical protein
MSNTTKIETYCRKFSIALDTLGIEGHEDIVAEIRSHLEAADQSDTLTEAMIELGLPADYARQFRDELRIENAYVKRMPHHTLGVLLTLSTYRTIAAIGLLVTGFAYITAIALLITIGAEVIIPEATGLWINESTGFLSFGFQLGDNPYGGATERLGNLYIPVTASLSLTFYIGGSWLGRQALGLMRKKRSSL